MQVPRKRPDVGNSRNKLTGGGSLQNGVTPKKARKLRAGLLALVVALAMVVAIPGFAQGIGDAVSNIVSGGVMPLADDNNDGITDNTVVDPNTTNAWEEMIAPGQTISTQNIGRIWTDKTVTNKNYDLSGSLAGQSVSKGDSDFLVGLSALSSTSNLRTTTYVTTPLDIVLVLDDSGSMGDYIEMDPADMDTGETYRAQDGWRPVNIQYNEDYDQWGYYSYGRWQNVDVNQTTIYQTKTQALKAAVNTFIDQTAATNATISDTANKIRLSVVQFATGTKNILDFTVCEGSGVQALKSNISELNSSNGDGATWADAGMEQAQSLINGCDRQDSEKIVIFFTDGEPNHGNGFDNDVAVSVVNTAHDIKQGGALIYTVGVFDDASPEDDPTDNSTENFNRYMHAVSSNFVSATAYLWGGFNVTWGERTEGGAYYKAAQNSGELSSIFEEIFDETTSNAGSGSPIEDVVQEGNTSPGTLTFTDQLGSYMQVTSINTETDAIQLVYGDRVFTSDSKSTSTDGLVDTYHFSGTYTANGIYGSANLSELQVKVTRSTDPAVGDKVEAVIPASLLPMRSYNVNTNDSTMTVSPAYPVRLFYGVSLKQDAKDALANPGAEGSAEILAGMLESNISADDPSKVDFYSNSWTSGANGTTTATFAPNQGNKFYYYTDDTALYIDSELQHRATRTNIESGSYSTLYYADPYWVQGADGSASEVTDKPMQIVAGGEEWASIAYDDAGNAYIPIHTERADRPSTLTDVKQSNDTKTADNVLVPDWTVNDQGDHVVTQYLGNNGKISFDAPGTLTINKSFSWGETSDTVKGYDRAVSFTVNFNGDAQLDGSYPYFLNGAETQTGTVTDNGTITVNVTDGSDFSLVIKNLPNGTTFSVKENPVTGFDVTDANDVDNSANTDKSDGVVDGTIASGTNQSVTFTNTYNPEPVTLSSNANFSGTKILVGRTALEGESFGFTLEQGSVSDGADWQYVTYKASADAEPVAFETATATADMNNAAQAQFWFGDSITFGHAGTYVFQVTESAHNSNALLADGTNGMTYDRHVGSITVTVDDNDGDGQLSATAVPGSIADGEGENDLTFENSYVPSSVTYGGDDVLFGGHKYVVDESGDSFVMENGQFTFMMRAQGISNPMPDGYDGTTVDSDGYPVMSVTNQNTDPAVNEATFDFGTITFDKSDMTGSTPVDGEPGVFSKTFQYNIYENENQMPAGVDPQDSGRTYTVTFTVVENQNTGTITVDQVDVALHNSEAPVDRGSSAFTPVYRAEVASGSTQIFKRLDGRNWREGDTFTFDISMRADGVTGDDLPSFNFNSVNGEMSGYAETENGLSYSVTITPQSVTGNTFAFNTGVATYTHEGVYVYTISERDFDATAVPNVSKDDTVYTVTVTIDDIDGVLQRTVAISPNVASGRVDFTNRYSTSGELDSTGEEAIKVSKDFTGRANDEWLPTDTFTVNLTAQDSLVDGQTMPAADVPMPAGAVDGVATLDLTSNNHTDVAFGDITYSRPGEYKYLLTETSGSLGGVTYSKAEYVVTVTATDNGDGTMDVTSKIEQTKNDGGTTLAPVEEIDGAATFGNTYSTSGTTVVDGETNLSGTKTLSGRDWNETDTFTFVLAAGDDATSAAVADSSIVLPNTTVPLSGDHAEGEHVPFSFGDIVFSKEGDYTFTISELKPGDDGFNGNTGGMTYDDHAYTVNVNVADNTTGGLVATVTSADGSNDWNNVYKAGEQILDGSANLAVTKVLDGRDWQEGDTFSFVLTADENNPAGATLPQNATGIEINNETEGHKAAFGDITFSAEGTYLFYINEVIPADGDKLGGVTYDDAQRVIEVVVEDNGDGELIVTPRVTSEKDLTFTNTYEPGGEVNPGTGDAEAQLTKVVDGRDWLEDETFSFEITADEGTPAETLPQVTTVEVAKPADGNEATFDFGPFTFNAEGVYHYTVSEINGGTVDNGMTYSSNKGEITISVTDDLHGGFSAAVQISNPVFTNTYSSELDYDAAGGLSIVKNLDGHGIAANQFEFTVEAADQASADKANITDGLTKRFDSTAAAMESGVAHNTFGLDFNTFTQEDVDHIYTYTVSETKGGDTDAGYTNDGTVYTVTIKTADSNDGVLTVTTTVSAPGMEDQVYTYTNNAQSTGKAQVVFNNAYDANGTIDDDGEGSVDINATKELVNGFLEGGEFTFVVTDANGKTVTTGTNAADGTIDFEQIEYTTDKLVADAFGENPTASYDPDTNTYTYEYQVAEDVNNLPAGVTANTSPFQIKVSVTDNNDGTLSFKVLYPENSGDSLAFRNTYGTVEDGSAELAVAGIKKLDMAEGLTGPDITGKYTFTLTGSEGAPMPDKAEAVNDSAGNVTFGTIEYTIENVFGSATADEPATDEADGTTTDENAGIDTQIAQRDKTFTYKVTESGNVAGVANDPNSTRTFTVTVIDNGDGTISLTDGDGNAIQGGLSFEFTNTYSVEPETSTPTGEGGITITKKLEGDRPMNAGEFAFVMVDVTTDAEVASGTNDENGNVELGGIEFTKPGTYQYKLYEAVGDLGGITYDRAQYIATATVTDNHDGTLSVAWTVTPADSTEPVDGLTFTNTYAPTDPGSIVFGASKVLNGDRELAEGEFTFELKNADGEVLQTGTNNADGSVVFSDPVEFDKAGEYTFTVSERLPEDDDPSAEGIQKDGVTYDETVYTATVNVADVDENGVYDGVLTASVSYGNDGKLPSFTNTYVKPAEPAPEEPTDAMPKTGDTSNVAVIGLGLAAMALVAGGVVLRRRTNR